MSHLTDSELVDALDGQLSPAAGAHVRDCAACRNRLADFAETLAMTRQAEMPEPSPLFWDHLSARIQAAMAERPPARRRWVSWPVLAPIAGLAVVVLALVAGLVRERPAPRMDVVAVDEVLPPDDAAFEAAWTFAASLLGMSDSAGAMEVDLVVRPGSAEMIAAQLTPDEQAELVRLLQQEIKAGG
jgi:hypothetical protein